MVITPVKMPVSRTFARLMRRKTNVHVRKGVGSGASSVESTVIVYALFFLSPSTKLGA
jgi:hypothetical protein